MAEIQSIIEEVRFITDYPTAVYSQTEMESAIEFSKNEIRGILNDYEQDFVEDVDNNARRALMWATCYHLKVKSGEIGGLPMKIGDVDISKYRTRGELAVGAIEWADKFNEYLSQIDGSSSPFGSTRTTRGGRVYEDDRSPYKELHE